MYKLRKKGETLDKTFDHQLNKFTHSLMSGQLTDIQYLHKSPGQQCMFTDQRSVIDPGQQIYINIPYRDYKTCTQPQSQEKHPLRSHAT